MVKLSIVLLGCCSALLRFDLSGPGDWWLLSTRDSLNYRVEASGYANRACHVTVPVDMTGAHKLFSVRFDPDQD